MERISRLGNKVRVVLVTQAYLITLLVMRCGRNKICSAAARLGVPGVNSLEAADALIEAKADEFKAKPALSQQLFAVAAPVKREAIVTTFRTILDKEGVASNNLEHGIPKGSTTDGLATLYGLDYLTQQARKQLDTGSASGNTIAPQPELGLKTANNNANGNGNGNAAGVGINLDNPLPFGKFQGRTLRDLLATAEGQSYLQWLAGKGNVVNRGVNYSEQAQFALDALSSNPNPATSAATTAATAAVNNPTAPAATTAPTAPPPPPAPLPAFLDPSSPHYIHGNKGQFDPNATAPRPPVDKEGYSWDGFKSDPHTGVEFDRQGYDRNGFDRDGYNRQGYNLVGLDREGYDGSGYRLEPVSSSSSNQNQNPDQTPNRKYDRNGYDQQGYDRNGFDQEGYDRKGYDAKGRDKFGYDADGFDAQGYDRFGYGKGWRDAEGYDADGFDEHGFDRTGYDENGKDRQGQLHPFFSSRDGTTGVYADGYDEYGRDAAGYFLKDGRDKDGFDREGYNSHGLDREGYNREGVKLALDGKLRDRNGYDIHGFNLQGLHPTGYNQFGFDPATGRNLLGYDVEGYDAKGLDYWGFDRNGYNPVTKRKRKIAPGTDGAYGYDNDGYTRWGFNTQGLTADKRNFCGWKVALEPDPEVYPSSNSPDPSPSSIPKKARVMIARNPKNPDEWMYHVTPGSLAIKPRTAQELLKPKDEIKDDGLLPGGKRLMVFSESLYSTTGKGGLKTSRVRTGSTPLNQPPLPSASPSPSPSASGSAVSAATKASFEPTKFDLDPNLNAYLAALQTLKSQKPGKSNSELALEAARSVPGLASRVTGNLVEGSTFSYTKNTRLELKDGGRLLIPGQGQGKDIQDPYQKSLKQQSTRVKQVENATATATATATTGTGSGSGSGSESMILTPAQRWYTYTRTLYDKKATLKGVPARCPKCGRFIAAQFIGVDTSYGGAQSELKHECPAFNNEAVLVAKSGLANSHGYPATATLRYTANDKHLWWRSKKPDTSLTTAVAVATAEAANLSLSEAAAAGYDPQVYEYENISYALDRRIDPPPGAVGPSYINYSGSTHPTGYNRQGYDPNGRNRQGRDIAGRDKDGFDAEGYDRDGYDRDGYHKRDGYDRNGYNREGDKRGLSTLDDYTDKFDGTVVKGDPINNEGIKQMLSNLCSALTGQPRRIVFREGGGFATDMKGTIYLEPYPLGKDKPIADNLAVVRGGLEHELGHELYTNVNHWRTVLDIAKAGAEIDPADTEGLNGEGRQLVPHVYNIIEDGRMERQVARLAGAAEHLALSCKIEPRWDEAVGEGVDPQHQVYGALLYTALPFFKVRDEVRAAMSPKARAIFEELEPLARQGVLGSQEDALAASLEITRRLQAHDFGKPPEALDIRPPADPPQSGNQSGSSNQSGSGGGQGQGQGENSSSSGSGSGSGSGSPGGGNSGGAGSGSGSSGSNSSNGNSGGSSGSGSTGAGAGAGAGGGSGSGTGTASEGTPGSGSGSGSSAGANRSSTGNAGGGSNGNNSQDENEKEKGDTTGSGGGKVGAQFGNQNARKNGASSADTNEDAASSKDDEPNSNSKSGSDDGAEAEAEAENKGGDNGSGTGRGKDKNDDGNNNNDANTKSATKDPKPPSSSYSYSEKQEQEEGVQTPEELTDWGDLITDKALEDTYRSLEREASRYVGLEVRAQARVENFGRALHRPLGVRTTHDTEEQVYLDGDGIPQKASVSFPKAGRLKFQSRRARHIQHGNALAKELRSIREQTEKTVSMQSRGRLDRGRFVQAVKGQRDVYNQTQEATKTSFAVSISLDQSGSMEQTANSGALLDATMTLSHALEQLDMAYEVRGFNNGNYQYKAIDDTDFDPYRAEVLTNANGGTHMAATAGLAMTSLAARPEKNRLAIYMTDGMLNDHLESKQSLLQARKKGITTFGIYLGNPESLSEWDTKAKLDELYGDGNWVVVSSIEQMPRSVGHKIATMLRRIR